MQYRTSLWSACDSSSGCARSQPLAQPQPAGLWAGQVCPHSPDAAGALSGSRHHRGVVPAPQQLPVPGTALPVPPRQAGAVSGPQ